MRSDGKLPLRECSWGSRKRTGRRASEVLRGIRGGLVGPSPSITARSEKWLLWYSTVTG